MDCKYNAELIPDASELEALPESACPVDWAKRCVDTAHLENCGKSVMCRDGMTQLALLIDDVVSGRGQGDDLALIKEICEVIVTTHGCELAQKAAGNVLASMEKYADAWDQHCRRNYKAVEPEKYNIPHKVHRKLQCKYTFCGFVSFTRHLEHKISRSAEQCIYNPPHYREQP